MPAVSPKMKTGPDLVEARSFFLKPNFKFRFLDYPAVYAVAAFTCDNAAATSFKSGTTGMS
jgi:hypothetical protein